MYGCITFVLIVACKVNVLNGTHLRISGSCQRVTVLRCFLFDFGNNTTMTVDSADQSPKCLCTTPLPLLRMPAHHWSNVCTGGSNYRLQFYLHIYSCTRRLCTKGRAAHLGQPVEELGGSSCLEEGLPQGCTLPPADLLCDMVD